MQDAFTTELRRNELNVKEFHLKSGEFQPAGSQKSLLSGGFE
jgi:hypothetical protein